MAKDAGAEAAQAIKEDSTFPFDYLFPELNSKESAHLTAGEPAKTVAALNALGAAMAEQTPPPPAGDSTIPPVYTYWGQFIDHDLTANTDRNSDVSDITKPNLTPLDPGLLTPNLHKLL